jgi:hypothetical protein
MAGPAAIDESGTTVEWALAIEKWIEAARPVLLRTAGSYNSIIEYGELGKEVQAATGITTKKLVQHWVGDVAFAAGRPGEPLLSSLVVDKESHHVGAGYAAAVLATYGREPQEDLQMDAAEERLKCYIQFGAEIPEGGGVPTLPKKALDLKRKAARKAFAEAPRKFCPVHHIQLPRSGQCDECEGS